MIATDQSATGEEPLCPRPALAAQRGMQFVGTVATPRFETNSLVSATETTEDVAQSESYRANPYIPPQPPPPQGTQSSLHEELSLSSVLLRTPLPQELGMLDSVGGEALRVADGPHLHAFVLGKHAEENDVFPHSTVISSPQSFLITSLDVFLQQHPTCLAAFAPKQLLAVATADANVQIWKIVISSGTNTTPSETLVPSSQTTTLSPPMIETHSSTSSTFDNRNGLAESTSVVSDCSVTEQDYSDVETVSSSKRGVDDPLQPSKQTGRPPKPTVTVKKISDLSAIDKAVVHTDNAQSKVKKRPTRGTGALCSKEPRILATNSSKSSKVRLDVVQGSPLSSRVKVVFLRQYTGHNDRIHTCHWSEGGFLVTSSADGTARIWNPVSHCCLAVLRHQTAVIAAAFHPRAQNWVYTASGVRVYRWAISPLSSTHWVGPADNTVLAHAFNSFSPECGIILVGNVEGTVFLLRADTLRCLYQLSLGKNRASITGIDITESGLEALVTCSNGRVFQYSLISLLPICIHTALPRVRNSTLFRPVLIETTRLVNGEVIQEQKACRRWKALLFVGFDKGGIKCFDNIGISRAGDTHMMPQTNMKRHKPWRRKPRYTIECTQSEFTCMERMRVTLNGVEANLLALGCSNSRISIILL